MREDSKVREPLWQRCEGRKKCERIGCFTVSRVALTAVCTPVGLGVCCNACARARTHARA